ncbi:MAG: pyridoxal-5'-phosphate-dependent protein, partial [Pseudomonas putida]
GVCPPFMDWSMVDERAQVHHAEMLAAQRWFYMQSGIFVGNTDAACLAVAQRMAQHPRYAATTLVTIAYDAGLWYQDLLGATRRKAA